MKSLFITGGAGFVGRWLARRALQSGAAVTLYDDLSVGVEENIAEFRDRVHFLRGDILDHAALRAAMEASRPECVVHLAAVHYIPYCNEHPRQTLRINGEGTYSVLQAAEATGVKSVLAISSGILYEDSDAPLHEDRTPIRPPDIYGLSKLTTENVARYFAETTPLRVQVVRLFNTYGPFEISPHLIPHIVRSAIQDGRVALGNTHTYRDYVYVEDVAELLFRLCGRASSPFTIVNLGTGKEHSVLDVVRAVEDAVGHKIEVVIDPARIRKTDKVHQRADIARLQELAGAVPAVTLPEGVRRLVEHLRCLV